MDNHAEQARPYLSVCAIYRDEAPYLREWIEFHRLVGVEHFFLYDNGSEDDHLGVLGPYLEEGVATLHPWPVFPGQFRAYQHCLGEHRHDSRWIAFIDIDEFLFSPTGEPVSEVFVDYEPFPGVGVNWAMFGTSGHRTKPAGLVIENYVRRSRRDFKKNNIIKSIVDPTRVAGLSGSAHHFIYHDGLTVDENQQPIDGSRTERVSFSRLRINHYWTKSEQECRRKLSVKPRVSTGELRLAAEANFPRVNAKLNEEPDDGAILAYLPQLREALQLTRNPSESQPARIQ